MKRYILVIALILALSIVIAGCGTTAGNKDAETPKAENMAAGKTDNKAVTVDHSKYVTGPINGAQDVTKQCIKCHALQAEHILATGHWNWKKPLVDVQGRETVVAGKGFKGINNFCISVPGNEARCTSCHIGYGWSNSDFDFTDKTRIDCLVCHDTTGTYKKDPPGAGYPVKDVDLLKVAQNVGKPSRANCGSCHFYGGGGDGVKSPGMDSSLIDPKREQDVHMGGDADMTCQACHKGDKHQIPGGSVHIAPTYEGRVSCENCHSSTPHKNNQALNNHTDTVACQTCHIPTFNTVNPTKVYWDWSTAGQDKEAPKDEFGKETYLKTKGDFIWAKNVKPTYAWYNGKSQRYLVGDPINKGGVTSLAKPVGSINDPAAKIYPFKVMKGKQVSDAVHGYLLTPQVHNGYWKHFDWNKALTAGAKANGLQFSGKYEFVPTEMYMAVNHEVVPKEKALTCYDCHGPNGKVLDFKALGYPGDPMFTGSRSK